MPPSLCDRIYWQHDSPIKSRLDAPPEVSSCFDSDDFPRRPFPRGFFPNAVEEGQFADADDDQSLPPKLWLGHYLI